MLDLRYEVDDLLVHRFFNDNSFDMLDDKIEVLEALKAGTPEDEIPKYYDILEDYPQDEIGEDGLVHHVIWD